MGLALIGAPLALDFRSVLKEELAAVAVFLERCGEVDVCCREGLHAACFLVLWLLADGVDTRARA